MSEYDRLDNMLQRIEDIDYFITQKDGKIVAALNDRILKPAIRMQLIALSEDFTRLTREGAYPILSHFNPEDIRGLNAVRNFIAHDYDSVDDEILELVLRKHLPIIRKTIVELTKSR